jgi:hypothetical protein
MLNLNHELLFLGRFDNGTHTMECKIGRKVYQLTIEKNSYDALVTLSNKLPSGSSKYGPAADIHMIFVDRDALIEREALERIAELEAAQALMRKFKYLRP